ncbi:GTP-binding protein [Chelativorans sp. J32]|uniref:CobW family GTP-binding protein n=1 Tax=Chelativorans sp. J32 TaxID=935840 RepID=UPI0004AE6592|nr:GTP-binding protein [Chelativorans sp. J32]
MESSTDGRIRLTILGGFLGSGKTTWLRHQLHRGLLRDAAVIVNEAAERPVDDVLLAQAAKLSVLAGGCACCSGRDELIRLLRAFCDERLGAGTRLASTRQIVLETSGLADPGPIVDALRSDPVLIHHIVVSEIVVTVDALHGLAQMKREPLSRRQIETADRLIVTKMDEAGHPETQRLLATLAQINPGAIVSGAIMGNPASLPDFTGTAPEPLGDFSPEADAPIIAMRLDLWDSVDWTVFSLWLSALLHARGEDVMRVKGVIRTPAGRLLLQTVRRVVQQPEILPDGDDEAEREDNSVAFIGRGFAAEDLRRSLRLFTGEA